MLRVSWAIFLLPWVAMATSQTAAVGADELQALPGDGAANQEKSLTAEQSAVIERTLQQLASPIFESRRTAFLQLWKMGSDAVPALNVARSADNRQLAEMAQSLLLLNKLQIVHGDKSDLGQLVELLTNATPENLIRLCELGYWELATELVINHVELKQALSDAYGRFAMNRVVEAAFEQGEVAKAWPLVALTNSPEVTSWIANKLQLELPATFDEQNVELQAVRLYFSGQIAEALQREIAPNRLIPMLTRGYQWGEFRHDSVQTALLRGESHAAEAAARAVLTEISGDPAQAELMWDEILVPSSAAQAADPAEPSADTAEPSASEAALDPQSLSALQMLRELGNPASGNIAQYHQLVLALLMDGRAEPVERYLEESDSSMAYSIHADQHNFSKAFEQLGLSADLAEFDQWLELQKELIPNLLSSGRRPDFDAARVANELIGLGEHDKAEQLLNMMAGIARRHREYEVSIWVNHIVRWLGRHESRALCMKVAVENYELMSEECQRAVVEGLFTELGNAAPQLFDSAPAPLAGHPDDSRWTMVERLHLWDRDYFGPEVKTVVSQWLRSAKQSLLQEQITSEHLSNLAKVARGFGYDSLALELLSTDLREEQGEQALNVHWLDAAEVNLALLKPEAALGFLEVLRRHGYNFQPAYVCEVEALLLTGEYDKANALNRSRWLRTLSESPYVGASYADMTRHYREREEFSRALEYAEPAFLFAETGSRFLYVAAVEYARLAEELDDYQLSADVRRAALVEGLQPRSTLVQFLVSNGYISSLRHLVEKERLARSVVCVQKGQFDAARRHLAVCKKLQPQDIEAVIQCYPLLVRAGEQGFAEQLFGDYDAALTKQIAVWPNDATALNNLAWMYSQCDRKLEEALELARRAVSLAPHSPVFLDTLAEVEFRLGRVDQALESMRDCVRLDPRDAHYRENLIRFQERRP